jgi:hypothetical protein
VFVSSEPSILIFRISLQIDEVMDPSATFDATMIANDPEVKRMYLAMATKQESPIVLKFK